MSSTYETLYSDIVSRMKEVGQFKSDTHLAKTLGITPQALSNYKKRRKISGDLVVKFSKIYGTSIDWLLTGIGEMLQLSSNVEKGSLCTIAFVKASPFVQGEDKQGVRVTSISTMSPDELISVGKVVKILRSKDSTISDAVKFSVEIMLSSVESINDGVDS